jgi:hypothetical protein
MTREDVEVDKGVEVAGGSTVAYSQVATTRGEDFEASI